MEVLRKPETPKLTFVRATTNDAPLLIELEQKVAGTKTYMTTLTLEEARDEIVQNTLHFIKTGSEMIGSIAYQMRPDNSIYISGVVVDPAYQGRGVARAALVYVLDQFKDAKRIDLVVHPDNRSARKLYESLGFRVESEEENYYGDGEPRLVLVKEYFAI